MDDLDDGFEDLGVGVGEHPVAEVEDVAAVAVGPAQHVAGPLQGHVGAGQDGDRVEVALEGDVVAEFTRGEGITYGMGFGDVGAAEADARFQAAVSSWMSNDFEAAQAELDALKEMGAQNENIERLQANLDVIQGGSSGGDAAAERRIKEQAKARAVDDYQRQEKTKQKAEEYRASGEYDKAEAEYEKILAESSDPAERAKVSKRLERLRNAQS